MAPCPCGSGDDETACCGPILDGVPAPTALALMRSRYTAYVRGAIDYLIETQAEETRGELDRAAIARWSRDTSWLGLEIVATEAGGPDDDHGIVEFVARGTTRGAPFAQRERSRFRRSDGQWYYVDGKTAGEPVRGAATPGRNDPCPCGSGMKYKRCHGA
ncbi:MAG TPA: YchJ family metal-binding protein [Kofleriaceae bacterium]|jgi:SEC-C motif-containing protein